MVDGVAVGMEAEVLTSGVAASLAGPPIVDKIRISQGD
jgi:hypothetical protein